MQCFLNMCERKNEGWREERMGEIYYLHNIFLFISHTHNKYTGTVIHIHANIMHTFHTQNIEIKYHKVLLIILGNISRLIFFFESFYII